jgi:predicted Zn-dependent protease
VEAQAVTGEIARLEALLGADSGSRAYPALAEANRRAGRLEEAERVAREGLRRQPDLLSGRVALALALLDLGRVEEARAELEQVLAAVPDHPVALAAFAERAGGAGPDSLEALGDAEIDGAFAEAETALGELVDANEVAARALRAADLDEPEGLLQGDADSPFATRTVADLLERQGHPADAEALRRELAARESASARPAPVEERREELIATLERWLENLRRTRR